MDKKAGNFVSHTIFQLPTAMGKGVLLLLPFMEIFLGGAYS